MREPVRKPFERDELIQELKKEFKRIGSLRLADYDKYRRDNLPASNIVKKRLGGVSWYEVLRFCEYESARKSWSKDKILNMLKKQNRQLTYKELKRLGINAGAVNRHFGSFKKLYDVLSWEYKEKEFYIDVTNDELLEEYDNVCRTLGKVATAQELNEYSKYPFELYRSRFGSLNEVRRLAGYEYRINKRSITKEQCMKEMLNVYSKHGRVSYNELNKYLPFHIRTLLRKFGTTSIKDVWEEVIKEHKKQEGLK